MSSEISEAPSRAASVSLPTSPKHRGEDVTFEEVRQARERLMSQGKPDRIRAVLAEVGRGSLLTIHKYVRVLRGTAGVAEDQELTVLSPHMTKALAGEIERLVKHRTAHLTGSLEDATSSLDVATEEVEELRAALAESAALLDGMRASSAEQTGVILAVRSQAESLAAQLASAHNDAESARQHSALIRAQLSASEERRLHCEAECERLREHIEETRRELQRTKDEFEREKRECVTLQVRLTAAEATETSLKQSAQRVDELQSKLGEARNQLAASDAERLGLVNRLEDARKALGGAESTVQKLLGKLLDVASAEAASGTTSARASGSAADV